MNKTRVILSALLILLLIVNMTLCILNIMHGNSPISVAANAFGGGVAFMGLIAQLIG